MRKVGTPGFLARRACLVPQGSAMCRVGCISGAWGLLGPFWTFDHPILCKIKAAWGQSLHVLTIARKLFIFKGFCQPELIASCAAAKEGTEHHSGSAMNSSLQSPSCPGRARRAPLDHSPPGRASLCFQP